jgi:hypothetical protein
VISAHDQAGNSSEQNVRFEVGNVDDDPPKFTSGGRVKVKGRLETKQSIYRATARDDGLPITFSLDGEEGDSRYFYMLDSEMGDVALKDDTVYGDKSKLAFFVIAEDKFGNTSRRKVDVTFKNVGDANPPGGSDLNDSPPSESDPFGSDGNPAEGSDPIISPPSGSDVVTGQIFRLNARESYTKKTSQRIVNFDVGSDSLEIRTEDFGLGAAAVFGVAKNKKEFKSYQKSEVDFIFKANKANGFIVFNQNGLERGLGDLGGLVAVINDSLGFTSNLVEFI